MLGKVWGWITAGIGAVMLALLVAYGTASGTWIDEHSGLFIDKAGHSVDPPSIVGLLIVTVLALVLLIGGVVVGIASRSPRGAVAPRAAAITE
jgi:hypothetical protein